MNKLLIICGPTATGKTKLALSFAKRYNGELISADSRQVYRGMDIGTGKDLPKELSAVSPASPAGSCQLTARYRNKKYLLPQYKQDGVPIWLYDIVRPDEEFSVGHYQRLGKAAIEDIQKRGKLPIIVGGTGLYIKSLVESIETISVPPNKKLRKELYGLSVADLQKRVQEDAPDKWELINESDRQNPRRLVRKIEIAQYGLSKLSFKEPQSSALLQQDVLLIGLAASLPVIYERIDHRVEERVKQGIFNEIKGLLAKGYLWDLPAMNTMGYKEWKEHFTLHFTLCTFHSAIERWKFHEHAYARRQMTWFRKQPNIHWFDITTSDYGHLIEHHVDLWYNKGV